MVGERRLIEEKFPIKELSAKSKREMTARPPLVQMNFYWARRPLISCRAAIIGSIVQSNITMPQFREVIKLNTADPYQFDPDGQFGKGLKILDPFAGKGSIPFEVLRAGAHAIASDLNPVSFLIMKTTMEYPIRYGHKLIDDLRKWGKWLINDLHKELGFLYSDDVYSYMWVWHLRCDSCGKHSPILKSWTVSTKKKISYELSQDGIHLVKNGKKPTKGNYAEGKAYCAYCNNTFSDAIIKSELAKFLEGTSMKMVPKLSGVILVTPTAKEIVNPRKVDEDLTIKAEETLRQEWDRLLNEDLIPTEEIAPYQSRGLPVVLYGYKYWYQMMNPRHLLCGANIVKSVRKVRELMEREYKDQEYAKALTSYLLLLLNKYVDFNNRSNLLDTGSGSIKHSMTFRGAIFTTDFYEPNPLVKASGTLVTMLDDIVEGLEFCVKSLYGKNIPHIHLCSALTLPYENAFFNIVVTDPPYENDVFYTELSDMMYVWLKKATNDYPDVLKYRTLWQELSQEEASNNPQRFLSSKKRMQVASDHYHKLMLSAFVEINRVLRDDGILVVFFSHSSTKAWSRLVNILMGAGFKIVSSWPVHTEMSQRPTGMGKEIIDTSIIVVARKKDNDEVGYLEIIRPQALSRVRSFVNHILNEQPEISWADLVNTGMGPAMEVISSYKEVKSVKGELVINDILNEISRVVTQVVLERLFGGKVNIDATTAIYILLNTSRNGARKKNHNDELKEFSSDYLSRLCLSLSIELRQVKQYNIVVELASKKKVVFRLVTPTPKDMQSFVRKRNLNIERPLSRDLCIIDVVHLMEYAFSIKGRAGLEQLSKLIPSVLTESALEVIRALNNSLPPNDEERDLIRPILGADADFKSGGLDPFF